MNRTARPTPPPRRTATTLRLGRRARAGGTATLSQHALSSDVVDTIAEHGEHVQAEALLTVLGPDGEPVAASLTRRDGRLSLRLDTMRVDPDSDHIWAWHEAFVERRMTVDLVCGGQVVVTIGDWDQLAPA